MSDIQITNVESCNYTLYIRSPQTGHLLKCVVPPYAMNYRLPSEFQALPELAEKAIKTYLDAGLFLRGGADIDTILETKEIVDELRTANMEAKISEVEDHIRLTVKKNNIKQDKPVSIEMKEV